MKDKQIYFHYGDKYFRIKPYFPITASSKFTKDCCGLWASRIDYNTYLLAYEKYTSDFQKLLGKNVFMFQLSDNAKILSINSETDFERLPKIPARFSKTSFLDLQELSKNYDAIESNIPIDIPIESNPFYGLPFWKYEDLLVMNKDVIQEI